MNRIFFLILILGSLPGCGKNNSETGERSCIPRESKILRCLADQLDLYQFPTAELAERLRIQCEREYPVRRCYSELE